MPILTTDIPGVPRFITGKVRDVYDLGTSLLVVATDRISAFDVILPNGIPDKGKVLTQISLFWFDLMKDVVPNHLISADIDTIAKALAIVRQSDVPDNILSQLEGRSMLVHKCDAIPLECVVRGYLAGSAWKDYKTLFAHGGEVKLYDIPIQVGLRESEQLPRPIFTPATKAHSGHDENVSQAEASALIGKDIVDSLSATSRALYTKAADYALERGIIIADTKFEFGFLNGTLTLIDEALTPDSSRFWDASLYKPGKAQPSFDKQFVRDYLETLDWDKTDPGPALPDDVVEKTAAKYLDAYFRITGKELPR